MLDSRDDSLISVGVIYRDDIPSDKGDWVRCFLRKKAKIETSEYEIHLRSTSYGGTKGWNEYDRGNRKQNLDNLSFLSSMCVRIPSSLSDFGRIYCENRILDPFLSNLSSNITMFSSKSDKNVLNLAIFSQRFPRSDRLLVNFERSAEPPRHVIRMPGGVRGEEPRGFSISRLSFNRNSLGITHQHNV